MHTHPPARVYDTGPKSERQVGSTTGTHVCMCAWTLGACDTCTVEASVAVSCHCICKHTSRAGLHSRADLYSCTASIATIHGPLQHSLQVCMRGTGPDCKAGCVAAGLRSPLRNAPYRLRRRLQTLLWTGSDLLCLFFESWQV